MLHGVSKYVFGASLYCKRILRLLAKLKCRYTNAIGFYKMEHSEWELCNKQYEENLMDYEDFRAVILRVFSV